MNSFGNLPSRSLRFTVPAHDGQGLVRTKRILREQLFTSFDPWKGGVLLLSGPRYLYDAVTHVVTKKIPDGTSCVFLKAATISQKATEALGSYLHASGGTGLLGVHTVQSSNECTQAIRRTIQTIQRKPRPRVLVCVDILKTLYDETVSVAASREHLRTIVHICKAAARDGVTVIFIHNRMPRIPRSREHFLPWMKLSSDLSVDFLPAVA